MQIPYVYEVGKDSVQLGPIKQRRRSIERRNYWRQEMLYIGFR